MKRTLVAGIAALALSSATARADLLDDVGQKVKEVKARRLAEEAKNVKAADAAEKKAQAELDKAEARLKKAQEELQAAQKKRTESEKAKSEASTRKKAAPALSEASRALAAAAASLAAGKADVDVSKGQKDPELALAAQALAGMAAAMKGDDKGALKALTPEVVAKFPSARRWSGLARLHTGDKDGAYKELKAASLSPADAVAQAALGELAAARNDLDTAQLAYGAAYAGDPSNPDIALGLALALIAAGHETEALAPLTLLASVPGNKQASYLLALAAEKAGERLKAEAALTNAVGGEAARLRSDASYGRVGRPLRVLPTHDGWTQLPKTFDETAARARLAWYRLSRGYPEAAAALDKIDGHADALFVRGVALYRLGRLAEARADLQKAADLEPKRPEPRQALGVVELEAGDASAAREVFSSLPSDDLAVIGNAVALAQLGKPKDAAALLGRLQRAPGVVGDAAATDLAAIERAQGNGADALKVMPSSPRTPEGWLLRGLLLAERKDARAPAAFRAALELQPSYVDAWLALAKADEQLNDNQGALAAATRSLELSPTLVEAMALRARVYGKLGDTARQSAELTRIREQGEKAKDAAAPSKHTIAVVAFENNSNDKALDWMKAGIAEALVSDLTHLGSLTVIERTQVQKAFQEQKLRELGFTDEKDASKIGKLLGADAVLVGSFSKVGDTLRLDGRVLEIGTTKILKTGSATGGVNQLFDVERKLALDLVSEYAAVTNRERVDFFQAKTPSLNSLETMSRIRLLSAEGKAAEAKAAYERLLKEDPSAAKQLEELKKGWKDVASTVAVLPLKNVSEKPEDQWLGVGIAEALTTDLKKVGLFLVERQQVEKLMQERQMTEIFNEEQALKLGKLSGASILFLGSYQVVGSYLRIDGRLVDVTSSQIMQAYTVEGKKDELFEAEGRLIKQVAAALKVEPSKLEKDALAQGKPSLDDFKRYIQASSKLVVKDAAPREISVTSLAIAQFKDAAGSVDAGTTAAVKRTLERDGRVPVRQAASPDPKTAPADALVLGTVTRSGDKLRVDGRAVATSTGEVIASATAVSSTVDADASREQVADALLASLGLRKSHADKMPDKKRVPVSTWLPWTIAGAVVLGTAAALGGYYGAQAAQKVTADMSITAH